MPASPLQTGQTNPKPFTFQFQEDRIDGIPLYIPSESGVTSCSNRRIVSIQENAAGQRFAVLYNAAVTWFGSEQLIIIGWGVLEGALQSGGTGSIAPTPLTYVDGDQVTVLRMLSTTYMIDYDSGNVPVAGIGTAYVNKQGKLSSSSSGNKALAGSVFFSVPSLQMTNQLMQYTAYYQLKDAVTP